jgi:hypothetical protein
MPMYSSRLKVVTEEKSKASERCKSQSRWYTCSGVRPVASPRTAFGFLFTVSAIRRATRSLARWADGQIMTSMAPSLKSD